MNDAQKRVVAEAPVSCRGVLTRAYTTGSRSAAIKAFCLRCVGYNRADVTNCTAPSCPLWTHRPYQAGQDDEDPPEIEGNGG